MNEPSVPIQPSTITTTRVITSFTVSVRTLELFESVTVSVTLYGVNCVIPEVKYITLSGQDYLDWNNDDQYLIDKVAEKLGFTIAPTPDPVVTDPTV